MRFLALIIAFNLFSAVISAPAVAAEKRNQLEELMIWKLSDELKLSSVEEKKFTEILKSLNEEKANLNSSLEKSIQAMGKATTTQTKEAELTRYLKFTQSYAKISEQEITRLKDVLGLDRMIQYLQLKQEFTNKIRSLLSSDSGGKSPKPLPPPKVIEEK